MQKSLLAGAVASALASSTPAWGQQPPVTRIERVTVTASPLDRADSEMAQPTTVLTEEELRRKRAASLGDTLSQELGVQSSSFGPAAGRPIIRGMDGPRIRVLENGIGTLDASSVSPDHAVTTESLGARQIEILRGPASLLYGSGAIGGVVNVVSDLIPRERAAGISGSVEARGGTANKERTGSFVLNGGAESVAWHLDAFSRKTKDYRIPGRAWRDGFEPPHEHEEGEGEEEGHEQESPSGRLPNSDVDARGAGAGASWVGSRGYLGAGVSGLRNDYGIPSPENARIAMRQSRFEVSGELSDPLPGFDRLRFRAGRNDYRHDEIESSGEIGTRFTNEGTEGRVELRHRGLLTGTLGGQFQDGELAALGEEAIVPRTRSRAAALFIVEEKDLGAIVLDAGLRVERERRTPDGGLPARSFSLATPAVGIVWKVGRDYRLGLSATQAQRAPSTEELYSNGAHHATGTFDVGDPALAKEVSRNVDLSLRKVHGDWRWSVSVFANRVRDYVYAANVDSDGDGVADRVDHDGEVEPEGEFLVQRFTQGRARLRGAEAEIAWRPEGGNGGIRLFADAVRSRLESGENLPRVPPSRFGASADWRFGALQVGSSVIRVSEQRRVAPLESTTPGYTRVDGEIAWRLDRATWGSYTLFLQGSNLTDREIRVHTSYLKDVAPQMGRSIVVGVRGEI